MSLPRSTWISKRKSGWQSPDTWSQRSVPWERVTRQGLRSPRGWHVAPSELRRTARRGALAALRWASDLQLTSAARGKNRQRRRGSRGCNGRHRGIRAGRHRRLRRQRFWCTGCVGLTRGTVRSAGNVRCEVMQRYIRKPWKSSVRSWKQQNRARESRRISLFVEVGGMCKGCCTVQAVG